MLDYERINERVREAALKAGEYIARERGNFPSGCVEHKGAHNLVSYVDREAERLLVDELRAIIPEAGFITEEGSASCGNEEYKWVVDPLDGTTNFVHGLPPYSVSIALMRGGEVVSGVVYEVNLREMFYAWSGSQAWMNGKVIYPSRIDRLENALVAVGFSYEAFSRSETYMEKVAYYQRTTDGIRRLGSSAVDLAYVACGRIDAFSQIGLSPWDVAAGGFIAQRAGAMVTNYSGGDDYIFDREIVAASPLIFEEFLRTVK